MLESGRKYTSQVPPDKSGHIPDNIKVHMENDIKIIPKENKAHLGDTSGCRIIPGEKFTDMETELSCWGIPLDSGENIKIVPPSTENK